MSRRSLLVSLTLLVLLVACGAAQDEPRVPPSAGPVSTAKLADTPRMVAIQEEGGPVPVSSADPSRGSRTALVTIVEIADFQCPFCARASATLDSIQKEYGPEKIRVVWKHMPLEFHPEARPAAEAAAAVMAIGGSDAFWKFHDRLFANQMTLSRASYEEWARESGVDGAKLRSVLESGAARSKVDSDIAIAKQLGAFGTPAFFVNGVSLSGAQPPERFRDIIDVELEKARAKLGSGVSPDKLHAAMAAENFKKVPSPNDAEEEDRSVYRVPVGKSPARGPASAQVTVVVFSDYQCPFCKRAETTLAEVESRYPGSLRFVWKDLPLSFHQRAEPAAQLALEARAQKGDGAFWAAHKKLFDSQPQLEDADLERIAKELSLDVKKAMAAVRAHKHKASIDADVALAEDFAAQGTPHFFINGRRLVGARPQRDFVAAIDEAMARAKAAVSNGAAPNDVYDVVTKDGRVPSEPEKLTVQVSADAPVFGPAKAPVTLMVFSDFQCPFCKKIEPVLADLRKVYGKKVRTVWRNLPLASHPDAHIAAEAAAEAKAQKGDGAFWRMHAALFARQNERGSGLDRASLEAVAKDVGLDVKKFADALDSGKHKARVDADANAASRAGISGTPTVLVIPERDGMSAAGATEVTGYAVIGAQPASKFNKLIDRALKEAAANGPRAVSPIKTPQKAAPRLEERRP